MSKLQEVDVAAWDPETSTLTMHRPARDEHGNPVGFLRPVLEGLDVRTGEWRPDGDDGLPESATLEASTETLEGLPRVLRAANVATPEEFEQIQKLRSTAEEAITKLLAAGLSGPDFLSENVQTGVWVELIWDERPYDWDDQSARTELWLKQDDEGSVMYFGGGQIIESIAQALDVKINLWSLGILGLTNPEDERSSDPTSE